ncbi:hypothetical protein [Brucella gallinifaecis]|uniref:hypothetical protein n=1 Tax=Brucella gallinifaecis TaxID=215590 RepID=UPI0023628839|nr:hypothetical protein [Brucella gallinifaecis]
MSEQIERKSLLAATDTLTSARSLLNAAFMAAGSLGIKEEADSIQQVLDIAEAKINEAIATIERIRKEGVK